MHSSGIGKTREERVKDSMEQGESIRDFAAYVPVGNAPEKLQKWAKQGAEICYLSALTEDKKVRGDEIVGKEGLKVDQEILNKYGFPQGEVYHRQLGESYADIAKRIMPDILVEDDCESIGREKEMTYTNMKPELKSKIKQIVVEEFQGIDHLPDDLKHLKDYGKYIFSPYHPLFEELFKKELTRLKKFLDKDILIEHVGSTAIKGLGGKGIIDILIGAPRDRLKKVTKNLQSAGYEFIPKASTAGRLFFQQDLLDPVERVRGYHIHLTFKNSSLT